MTTKKRLPELPKILLISFKHIIEPREEFLSAVVGVEDDGDTVVGGDGTDVVGEGD